METIKSTHIETIRRESEILNNSVMLEVRNLRKAFYGKVRGQEEVCALDNVSLEVSKGQFFTLVGPSGCGKSTLLRCIAGLETPEKGEIKIDGRTVYNSSTGTYISADRRRIGMVFQSYAIWPHLSVIDNAAFGLRFGRDRNKISRRESHNVAQEMLDRFGLTSMSSRSPMELSGGQQQRLAVARALLSRPSLLLLDEPLSNLDAERRVEMRVELRRVQREFGITTVYVTHDQSEALSMSDLLAVVVNGKIVESGVPQEMYFSPRTSLAARVTGRVNLVPVRKVTRSGETLTCETELGEVVIVADSRADNFPMREKKMLSIRPETVRIIRSSESATDKIANVFEAFVSSTEFVGDHVNVSLKLGNLELEASISGDVKVSQGDFIFVELPKNACLVDA